MADASPLKLVDGRTLSDDLQRVHRPGDAVRDESGRLRRLPRYFYEVPSWQMAVDTALTEHFALYEFVSVDVRESPAARAWPRYVPCAVTLLAAHLEVLRCAFGERMLISANGAYRTPAHGMDRPDVASPHHWGTAVDLYRIGDDWLEDEATIDRYRTRVEATLPGVWTRPFGVKDGAADDHLHLDFGFALSIPRDAPDAD